MAYANFAAKREAGILRGLREATGSVRDAGLRNRLRMHCRKIERVSTETRRLRAMMQLRVGLQAARAFPKRATAR
jgi:hypothetical protein